MIAENVEVDMETLKTAQSFGINIIARDRARVLIIEAVIKALYPEDREKLEAYKNQ